MDASSLGQRSSQPPLLSMEEQHELLLIDFDTSVFIEDPVAASRSAGTPQRRLVGTYGYLAPEVLIWLEFMAAEMLHGKVLG